MGEAESASLEALRDRLREFAEARDWEQFHTPKNLAMALSVEAGELLQEFLWASEGAGQAESLVPPKRERVAEEIADVFLYLVRLADRLDIDLLRAADAKIEKNAVRYPADVVRGRSDKMPRLSPKVDP